MMRVALARRGALEDAVGLQHADGEGVHQAVAVVRLVEGHLAAHRGHADAVAVAGDARHHAVEQPPRLRVLRAAEAQRVQVGDGPRAHGEDVAQDAAHAGGGALVGLDVAGVVVRLHLEGHRVAVADGHHAGVLARPHQHVGAGGGELLQVNARRLVRAVLAPQHREDAQLEQVGVAPQQLHDALVLVGLEPVLRDDLGRMHGALLGEARARWPPKRGCTGGPPRRLIRARAAPHRR